MKKSSFELITEQFIVVIILIVHLCGFMNITHQFSNFQADLSREDNEFDYYNKNFKNIAVDNLPHVKVVIMVIDALRVDHLVSNEKPLMKYSDLLLQKRQGLGYAIKTATPTVTLPRIKTMVTGSISGFMDVIFNFASKELLEENIINFWRQKGRKIHFLGDDTWLKLFPTHFDRKDGVASFFVSDYTQVDSNVTRHLTAQYLNSDLDVLILHYLGLDHIGHLEGPNSSLVHPKLVEMDNVIQHIHKHVKQSGPYIFLVCGDHGMSDVGGHGGATHSEIWTSLLLMTHLLDNEEPSPFLKNSSLRREELHHQVDIVPTLALLTGIKIPRRNIGRPFTKIIRKLPVREQLFAHYVVMDQLMHHARSSPHISEIGHIESLYLEVTQLHKNLSELWKKSQNADQNSAVNKVLNLYEKLEMMTSSSLLDVVQSYDLTLLVLSSFMLILIAIVSFCSAVFISRRNPFFVVNEKMAFLFTIFFCSSSLFCVFLDVNLVKSSTLLIIPPVIYGACKLKVFCHSTISTENIEVFDDSLIQKVVFIATLFHPFTLLATSLVEEEHFTHYFTLSTVYFLLFFGLLRTFLRLIFHVDDATACGYSSFLSDSSHSRCPAMFDLHVHFWMLFNSIWKLLFHFQLYDKTKNKSLFMKYIPNLAIIFLSQALFRYSRAFNATGDKWKHLTHLNDLLKGSEQYVLQLVIVIGILITFSLYYMYGIVFVSISLVGIVGRHYPVFDEGIKSGIFESQMAFLAVFLMFLLGIFTVLWQYVIAVNCNQFSDIVKVDLCVRILQYIETAVALMYLLIQKPENILLTSLLFLHFHLILPVLVRLRVDLGLSRWNVYVVVLWIAQAHFFLAGNSNSLSSVQINAGFVGVASYRPVIHGILIVLHTFGSRFLVLLHFVIVSICYEKKLQSCNDILWTWWLVQLVSITVYVINVTLQRYHLFIWSVFAPKLLYEECHLLCLIILTLVVKMCVELVGPSRT